MVESTINETENVEQNTNSDYEKAKAYWNKHKKKYIVGGVLALTFGFDFWLGI